MIKLLIPSCFSVLLLCWSCSPGSGRQDAEAAGADTTIEGKYKESAFSKALIKPGTRILQEEGWYIWDCSPIAGEDGKIHVFYSRWRDDFGNWLTESEVAHAVAEKPEGPYRYVRTVLKGRGDGYWDAHTIHNPTIQQVGDRYVIFYMANNLNDTAKYDGKAPSTQRVGMAIADDLYGEFERVGNGPILVSQDKNDWDNYMNNNPALLQHPNGQYWLYYKAWDRYGDGLRKVGVAFADDIEGPYQKFKGNPVLSFSELNKQVEDPYIFHYKDKFYMITRDMGVIHPRVGLIVTSDDGLNWSAPEMGYRKSSWYFDEEANRFERPQVLFLDGRPAYLFLSLKGGKYGTSTGAVLKIDPEKF